MTTNVTIGLLWHSVTSDNLGVGALTLSQMVLITEAARRKNINICFNVIGTRGTTPYVIDDFEIKRSSEFALKAFKAGRFQAIPSLWACDIVFDIGEGDSFADIYGIKRLLIISLARILVKIFGLKLILSPQTIGPFRSRFGKLLGKLSMRLASRVYARDHLSVQCLRQMGFQNKSEEIIDVAFALPFQKKDNHPKILRMIGLNVSGLLYNGGYTGKNQFGLKLDYCELIDMVCAFFLEQPNTEVYLVPHVISDTCEQEDDLRVSLKLQTRHPRLKLAPRFRSPIEAKSFISCLDFFVGARMHACIAAFSSGVPVVPMAYSRKFNGLFSSINYPVILDCLKLDTQEGLQVISNAYANYAELIPMIAEGNRMAQAKLETYVQGMVGLLPSKSN